MGVLGHVAAVDPPQWWVGAGVVRDVFWDGRFGAGFEPANGRTSTWPSSTLQTCAALETSALRCAYVSATLPSAGTLRTRLLLTSGIRSGLALM